MRVEGREGQSGEVGRRVCWGSGIKGVEKVGESEEEGKWEWWGRKRESGGEVEGRASGIGGGGRGAAKSGGVEKAGESGGKGSWEWWRRERGRGEWRQGKGRAGVVVKGEGQGRVEAREGERGDL